MKKKTLLSMLCISLVPLFIIWVTMPETSMFADEIDWISQHVTIPDYFRTLWYETKDFFPDFAPHLQAGSNIYAFSYYGLFRPDVLIAYLLPMLSMKTIMITYSIGLIILGGNTLYLWLRNKRFTNTLCMVSALMYVCSAIFFQSHRQIMFVNFMPFLIMALMSIDYFLQTKKGTRFTLCLILIILHSYFFSIAAIIVCLLYFIYESHLLHIKRKPLYLPLLISVVIAMMVCALLLIPTAYVILENSKSVASTPVSSLFIPQFALNGLLYNAYGCGVSLIVWAAIILGLAHKKTRIVSYSLLVIFLFPIISFILNGCLYARSKILIVFLPIVLYQLCQVITLVAKRDIQLKWYQLLLFLFPLLFMQFHMYIVVDCIFTIILLALIYKQKNISIVFLYTLTILLVCVNVNAATLYLDKKLYERTNAKHKDQLLSQVDKQRIADFSSPLYASNQVFNTNTYRTSSYTSTNNTRYNTFLYDTMKQSIRIANRSAMVDESNIFVQGLLGIQGIITTGKVPVGYHLHKQAGPYAYYTNEDVMPIAYATDDLMSEATFDTLAYPYTLDTIYNNAIVKEGHSEYQSDIQPLHVQPAVISATPSLQIDEIGNTYPIRAPKQAKLQLQLPSEKAKQILIIQFDVKDVVDHKEVSMTINGVKNKLSKGTANYPNGNQQFTYVLSNNENIEQLEITFSKGQYTLENIKMYTLDYAVIKQRKQTVDMLHMQATTHKEVLSGTINVKKDGYLITSLAYQKGYKAYIDDKEVPVEIVNKAFVGFPIQNGNHQIRIEYTAPFKQIGVLISICGSLLVLVVAILERRQPHANKSN